MPISTVGTGRIRTSPILAVRGPDLRSSTNRTTMAAAPASSAAPSRISTFFWLDDVSPSSRSR